MAVSGPTDSYSSVRMQPLSSRPATLSSVGGGTTGESGDAAGDQVSLGEQTDLGLYRPIVGVPRSLNQTPPVAPDAHKSEEKKHSATREAYHAVKTTVEGVQSALTKDRSVGTWEHQDGNVETRFGLMRGHVDVVKSFNPSLGLRHQKLHGEFGLRLEGDVASAMMQRVDKGETTTVTTGARAALTGHLEAVQHSNQEFGQGGMSAESKADNGLHQAGSLTAHLDAYRNWNCQLSPTAKLDMGVTVGVSHTLAGALGPSPGSSQMTSTTALTAAAYQNYQQDISKKTFLGDKVLWRASAAEGVVENLSTGQLGTSLQVGTGLEKKFNVAVLGKERGLTVGLGGRANYEIGAELHFSPDVKLAIDL